jgi:transcriptional regulator with XRE-family HTH domain
MPWTFFDYVNDAGRNVIRDWVDHQPHGTRARLKARLNALLNELRLMERLDRPSVGQLHGRCSGLYELVLKIDKIQFRPIGCYGPAKTGEFTLVAGAIERAGNLRTKTFARLHMNEPLGLTTSVTFASTDSISAQVFSAFADVEYRHAYVDEHINTFVPLQIRTIREQRGWTQAELGQQCGGKAQGWISKLEDPNYGKFSLATLRTLAKAFDCLLEVRFKSFKDYSDDQDRRREGDTIVNAYEQDAADIVEAALGSSAEATTSSRIENLERIDIWKAKNGQGESVLR